MARRNQGCQYLLRSSEKEGNQREIPLRRDLKRFILDYLQSAGLRAAPKDSPLFRAAVRQKRRLQDAGLPARFSPHSFRWRR